MKKFIKRAISISAIASMLLVPTLSASAAIAPLYYGDVNRNYKVDVNDVTLLQEVLAGSATVAKRQMYTADVNLDNKVDVNDVTAIQNYLAGNIEFEVKAIYNHTLKYGNLYIDYDSGKAMAGVPVTFYAEAIGGIAPLTYEFSINDEVVQERSEASTLTYTFEESGIYSIKVKYYNIFDEYVTEPLTYEVVEPYESEAPIISSIYGDRLLVNEYEKSYTVTANAIFGTAPYQYKFTLDDGVLVQDYSDDNTFFIDMKNDNPLTMGDHEILVEVKDANGETATETFAFYVDYKI